MPDAFRIENAYVREIHPMRFLSNKTDCRFQASELRTQQWLGLNRDVEQWLFLLISNAIHSCCDRYY
ncbi:hypothetical protein QGP82_07115 [Leptothoe sp. LEGE 181152]|nr:hypothetical protein [Leptothoe sp. LEGE 181152]